MFPAMLVLKTMFEVMVLAVAFDTPEVPSSDSAFIYSLEVVFILYKHPY